MDNKPIIERRHDNDCLGCRLVSGFGVIGIGFYIYSQAKHSKTKISRNSIYTIAGVFASIGTARLFNLKPFKQ